jgi:hypothetical protein
MRHSIRQNAQLLFLVVLCIFVSVQRSGGATVDETLVALNDYVVTNPTILRPPSTIAILARAFHPYAAALFLDYHLSKEASEIMVNSQGRWAPRKDVPWTVEPPGDPDVVSALKRGPQMRNLVDPFNKNIGQKN